MDLCFFQRPVLALGLALHHAGEDAAQLQQLCGQVLFCHYAVLQHHDLIRAGNGAHPMSNDENSFVPDEAGKRFLNRRFIFNVQTGSCLVQQNDWRVFQEGTGDGNALPLAAGKLAVVLADVGVPTAGQFFGKLVHFGELCRRRKARPAP